LSTDIDCGFTMLSGLLALITAALFTGAAIYVSVVEHPARMQLDDTSLLVQWKPAYARGAVMQASLAIVGFLLGLLAWWQSGNWLWLTGALVLVANWPYTLVIIMPVNNGLKGLDPAHGALARPLLETWGKLHAGRSALGVAATLLYLLASLRQGPY
jgi:hypothetical protein